MNETDRGLAKAFAAESRAAARNRAFALKADQEGFPQLAQLFRAIADGQAAHAHRYLLSMRGKIADSEENLDAALTYSRKAVQEYPDLIRAVDGRGGPSQVKKAFSHALKVAEGHVELLRGCVGNMGAEKRVHYYVCQICGFISEDSIPDNCPVCHAVKTRFRKSE